MPPVTNRKHILSLAAGGGAKTTANHLHRNSFYSITNIWSMNKSLITRIKYSSLRNEEHVEYNELIDATLHHAPPALEFLTLYNRVYIK